MKDRGPSFGKDDILINLDKKTAYSSAAEKVMMKILKVFLVEDIKNFNISSIEIWKTSFTNEELELFIKEEREKEARAEELARYLQKKLFLQK
jgi:hypothetical protein